MEQREVVIGDHRADIRTEKGVIELQYSPISPEEIREREAFYGAMVWVVDGRWMTLDVEEFGFPVPRFDEVRWVHWLGVPKPEPGYSYWHWRRPKRSFAAAKKRVFIDLGDEVLECARMVANTSHGFLVLGRLESRDSFLARARLRPTEPSEQAAVLSHIVHYVPHSERTVSAASLYEEERRPSPRRREFLTLERARRWLERREPEQYEVRAWMGTGELQLVEDFARDSVRVG